MNRPNLPAATLPSHLVFEVSGSGEATRKPRLLMLAIDANLLNAIERARIATELQGENVNAVLELPMPRGSRWTLFKALHVVRGDPETDEIVSVEGEGGVPIEGVHAVGELPGFSHFGPEAVTQNWEDGPMLNFSPDSARLSVSSDAFGMEIQDRHSDDTVGITCYIDQIPGLSEALAQARPAVLAEMSTEIAGMSEPVEAPAARDERQRG